LCTEGTALLYRHAFGKLHRSRALLLICVVSLYHEAKLALQKQACYCTSLTGTVELSRQASYWLTRSLLAFFHFASTHGVINKWKIGQTGDM
jgi:hypothetical protein